MQSGACGLSTGVPRRIGDDELILLKPLLLAEVGRVTQLLLTHEGDHHLRLIAVHPLVLQRKASRTRGRG